MDNFCRSIYRTLNANNLVGFALFNNDRLVYASGGFCKVSGYTRRELKGSELSVLFGVEVAKEIIHRVERDESWRVDVLELKRKDEGIRFCSAFVSRIEIRGRLFGILYVADETKEALYASFYRMLSDINQAIIMNTTKKSLFSDVCNRLIKNKYIDMVWITEFRGENEVGVISYAGGSRYLEYSIKNVRSALYNGSPIVASVKKGEIVLNEYTKGNKSIRLYVDEMLKSGYLSSCYIPLRENGKYRYSINIYSRIPFFFNKAILPVLREIQGDINFSLNNMKELFYKRVFYEAIKNTKDWVLVTDVDGKIVYVNDAVCEISGYTRREIIGENPRIFKSDRYDEEFYRTLWNTILLGKVFKGIIINKAKNGSYYQLYHTISPVFTDGEVTHFVAISKDVSREVYLEEQVRKFKYYDNVTDMLNSVGFAAEVDEWIKKLESTDFIKAVIVVDLYRFAHINEVYGVYTGDKLLKDVGLRLSSIGFVSARLGDDEFAIFGVYKNMEELEDTILSIIRLFETPFIVDEQKIDLGVNIGIAVMDKENETPRSIISNASTASNDAKKLGKNKFKIFDEHLNISIQKDFSTERLITESIRNGYFTFYLQPIYSTHDGRIVEFESLARIIHPVEGFIPPSEFINQLEKSYHLVDFEEYLIRSISNYLETMKEKKGYYIPISINLSMKNLASGEILGVLGNVRDRHIPFIILEITERMFSEDLDRSRDMLKALKGMGFKIIIDDFGTGYSSLSYIHTLPIDAIKIDMSFIRNMIKYSKVKEIVRVTIEFAKRLNMKTVAEGVELKEQIEILKEFGCDYVQGYYFCKPLPFDEILKMTI